MPPIRTDTTRTHATKPLPHTSMTLQSWLNIPNQERPASMTMLPPNVSLQTLIHIQSEERCVWLNKQVWNKKKVAEDAISEDAPEATVKQLAYAQARANYELEFGSLLPEIADPAWTAQRNHILTELDNLSQEAALYSPIRDRKKLARYLALRNKCAAKFRICFNLDGAWRATLAQKTKELREYEILISASSGKAALMDDMAGELFCFTVINPYCGSDLRRVEFDRYLRQRLIEFTHRTEPLGPTLTHDKFEFYLPNNFLEDPDPEERYLCWCRRKPIPTMSDASKPFFTGRIFKADILARVAEARGKAEQAAPPPSPISGRSFHNH
ncbi:hypothetical protein C8F04DRAFT_1278073 [Mycena alexandri]|uniref:Uncharacterized protein n=1 Tax=Mycena alexandri TaxID=1745969 RepID=A0AAD6RZQ4_9AGAR|nr:hypothetical protein C8F04DRAFT_1278073 [Mycena alexandri]